MSSENQDSQPRRVLIVDDEAAIRDSMKLILQSRFVVDTAGDGQEALSKLRSSSPDVIVLDVMMPTLGGLETLRQLRAQGLSTPVVMLSAAHSIKNAVEAMKLGAVDFLEKPFDVDQLATLLGSVAGTKAAAVSEDSPAPQLAALPVPSNAAELVGDSSVMQDLRGLIDQVAGCDATVLVTGESGTGKEMVARALHAKSKRASGPFVAINCAAIPETLIESELFGHEKGAFTHAVDSRIGLCELANGGTLFLDEIGELALSVQVKLLRFLQEQEFYRVGSTKPVRVNVRIVAATNKNLENLIAEKRFREDLYYRLHVVHIPLAPLRDKLEDIPVLIEHFLAKLAPLYGGRKLLFSAPVLQSFAEYLWPGNVRELENMIESLVALADTDTVELRHLPAKLTGKLIASSADTLQSKQAGSDANQAHNNQSPSASPALPISRDEILKALKRANYALPRAAELLGVSRRILRYQMDRLGIPDVPPH